jgi:transaldolase
MMLTESLRDPFAHIFADLDGLEVKSVAALRPRRTLADRVRAALMGLTGGSGTVLVHSETAWASITFSGTRHEVVLEFCGADAVAAGESLIEHLPDHEFAIARQLVADATISAVDHRFGAMERLEVTAVLLLLEEG